MITNLFRLRPGGKRQVELEDAVIVMDGSGSIGTCEFGNGKRALKNMVQYKTPGVDAKYAMVTFSNGASVNFNFLPQSKAATKIGDVIFPNGGTNTQAGLAEALGLFTRGKSISAY